MDSPKYPIKLSELAEKWNKREKDLLLWIIEGKMEVQCWYNGHLIPIDSNIRLFYPVTDIYSSWVRPDGGSLYSLHSNQCVDLTRFRTHFSSLDYFSPAKISSPNDTALSPTKFPIKLDDLFIQIIEVERMEREHPELISKKTEQLTAKESEIERQPIKQKVKKEKGFHLLPSEKKSLLKMLIGMTHHLKYDPEAKKSDVPGIICKKVHEAGLTIDETTVKKWLDAAAKLKDRMVEDDKEKLKDLQERQKNA